MHLNTSNNSTVYIWKWAAPFHVVISFYLWPNICDKSRPAVRSALESDLNAKVCTLIDRQYNDVKGGHGHLIHSSQSLKSPFYKMCKWVGFFAEYPSLVLSEFCRKVRFPGRRGNAEPEEYKLDLFRVWEIHLVFMYIGVQWLALLSLQAVLFSSFVFFLHKRVIQNHWSASFSAF